MLVPSSKRKRFGRRSIVVATLAGLCLSTATPTAIAAPKSQPVIQVASASDKPARSTGEVFSQFTAYVYIGSLSSPYITGFSNADGPIYVDDELDITVESVGSNSAQTKPIDFTGNCDGTGPKAQSPIFLRNLINFPRGLNKVTFTLRDKCGQNEGSSNIFLTGAGVVDFGALKATNCLQNLTKAIGGLSESPIYAPINDKPVVGTDHKIHATGGVNVNSKVNCTATVEVALQTKVCNRFGFNCNPRNIATTGVRLMPDSGTYAKQMTGACRTGKDDYRIQVRVHWETVNGLIEEVKFPVLDVEQHVANDPDGDKGWTSLQC